jgi:hypothetical protein
MILQEGENSMRAVLPMMASLVLALLPGCAQDRHQHRAEAIKSHTAAFYEHLLAGRVPSAIIENERIEALAAHLGQQVLERRRHPADNEVDRDWMMLTTARESAADNWLSLARYFVLTKRFEEARGTYQRLLKTYSDPVFRRYSDQARNGLQDLDMILDPAQSRGRGSG